jgi:hypothetical protein
MEAAAAKQTLPQRIWAEARRSVVYGVLVLALALILFGTFVSRMPRFKVRRVAGPAGGRGCSATAPDPPAPAPAPAPAR